MVGSPVSPDWARRARRRLTADVPVATMCSGGIDSSRVTAFARDERPGVVAHHAAIADQPAGGRAALRGARGRTAIEAAIWRG